MIESRIRLWDKDFNLLYSSETDPRSIQEFMNERAIDEVNYTEDFEPMSWTTRRAGKIIRDANGIRRYNASGFLNYIISASNPSL